MRNINFRWIVLAVVALLSVAGCQTRIRHSRFAPRDRARISTQDTRASSTASTEAPEAASTPVADPAGASDVASGPARASSEASEPARVSDESSDTAQVSSEPARGSGTASAEASEPAPVTDEASDAARPSGEASEAARAPETAGAAGASGGTSDPAQKVGDIFAGASNAFFVPLDGTFWSVGNNSSGQLGLGGSGSPRVAWEAGRILVDGEEFPEVVSAESGETHTVILMSDASVWGAGESLYGELGQGDGNTRLVEFARLKDQGGSDIVNVKIAAVGNNSTFLVMGDNSLWAAGYNYYGNLGLGDRENRSVFTRVESAGRDVAAVAAGVRHTVILKTDGTVWAAGLNHSGQLGMESQDDINVFTRVEGAEAAAIAAGNYHTVLLKSDGSVWTVGDNFYGQLGHNGEGQRGFGPVLDAEGNAINDAAAIAARGDITLILRKDGSLLVAGSYAEPEYDVESVPPQPVEGEPESTFVPLEADGGAAPMGTVKKAVLGNRGIYSLTEDGFVWAAGSNWYGQLFMGREVKDSDVLRRVYPPR